jgi:hypothetical protein
MRSENIENSVRAAKPWTKRMSMRTKLQGLGEEIPDVPV